MNKIDLECGWELKGSVEFYWEIHDSFICIPCKIQAHLGCTFHISSISFSEMAKPLLEDLIHWVDVIKSVWKNIPTHNRCEDEYDYIDIAQETISQFRSEYEAHEKLISKLMLSKDNSFRYKREMILLSKQMMIFKTNLMESEIWKSTTNYMIQRTNKDTKCLIQPSELNNSHLKDRKKIISKILS